MIKNVLFVIKFNSKNGIITCSDMCYEIRNKERLEKNELIRQNKLKREHKKCPVCGKKFEINKSHLVYCSAECRPIIEKIKIFSYEQDMCFSKCRLLFI